MPRKQTKEEFIQKSIVIFGDAFDYSKVEYINSWTKVILVCKQHGDFSVAPRDHLCYERGCILCAGAKHNIDTFLAKAAFIHGDRYDYDLVVFNGVKTPITIICKNHGPFNQTPDKHFRGQGCPKCKKSARKDQDYIINTAIAIHGNKYDYSKVVFTKIFDPIIVVCPKHGDFTQTPANHINHKQDCPRCVVAKSKKEKLWLDSIGLPDDKNHRTVILKIGDKKIIVDGYDPATDTIYEFYGDFWHGNPSKYNAIEVNHFNHLSFGQLYDKTLEREEFIKQSGYSIMSIWESDFDKMRRR